MALAVFFAALTVLLLGVSPEVHWFDGGELTAAAFGLGLSHPPGQPPHAMLGRLFVLLPLGPVPLRVGLASVLPAAGLAAAAASLARALLRSLEPAPRAGGTLLASELPAALVGLAAVVPALVAGQATRVEVYALSAFLWLVGLALLARWDGRDLRVPVAASFAAGLAVSTHPLIGACGALASAALVVSRRVRVRPRLLLACAAAGLVGLASWAYMPLRGAAGPPLAWGDATSLAGLAAIASGRDYWMNLGGPSLGPAGSLAAQVELLGRSLGWATVGLAALGLGLVLAADRRLGLGTAAALAAGLAVMLPATRFLADNPDTQGKMAAAAVLVVVLAGVGLVGLVRRLARASARLAAGPAGRGLAVGGAGVLLLSLLLSPSALCPRPRYPLAETYALAALESAPPRALGLVAQDHLAFPVLYSSLVEGARPDVAVAIVGLSGNRWHLESLARRHPHLAVPLVRADGPAPAAGRWPLQERIAAAMASASAASVPVLLEPGVALPGLGVDRLALALPWLALDRPESAASSLLAVADAEHDRNASRYRDGGDRVWRLVRLQRAEELRRRGRAEEAGRTLAAALGGTAARALAPLLERLPRAGAPAVEPGPPGLGSVFLSEPDQPAVALAALLAEHGQLVAAAALLGPLATPAAEAVRAEIRSRSGEPPASAAEGLSSLGESERAAALSWWARRAAGRGERALVEGALELLGESAPERMATLVAAGVALGRAGDVNGAISLLERASRLDPDDAAAWTNLGVAQARAGRPDEARRSFRAALAADPADPAARRYLDALEGPLSPSAP